MATPVTADDCGGDPPPNGDPVLPIQPSPAHMNFHHSITEKLNSVNYLFWNSQVEPVIRGHCLHHFTENLQIPEWFATLVDPDAGRVTTAY